jgi:hypothetical protein
MRCVVRRGHIGDVRFILRLRRLEVHYHPCRLKLFGGWRDPRNDPERDA